MNIFLGKVIKLTFIFTLFLQSFALSIENKIMLKINNQIITTIDVYQEANYLKALNPNIQNLDKKKILDIARSSLIREKIKEIELSKYKKNKIDPKYLEQIIQSIYTKIDLENKSEFKKYVKNFGIDIEIIEKKLQIETRWNQLIYKKFFSKLKIDKESIRKNIDANREKSISFLLYEIVFSIDKDNQNNEVFNSIEKSILKEGFENAAAIYSISESSKTGGNLGWVNENNINNKILKNVNTLEIGQHTKPILIPGGFLILQLKDKKNVEKKIDIEKELVLRIRSLQNQQLNQYSNIYFKKIKKDILINEK
jgi:peptidyl-prolyl cis-trans isomerase SurA